MLYCSITIDNKVYHELTTEKVISDKLSFDHLYSQTIYFIKINEN